MAWANDVGGRVMGVEVRRRRRRTERRWLDSIRVDIREKGLSGEEVCHNSTWGFFSSFPTLAYIEVGLR